jgi:anti-anti-sigma factor
LQRERNGVSVDALAGQPIALQMGRFGFSVRTEWSNGTVILLPAGELDVMTASELERVIEGVVGHAPTVVVDLSAVRFVDCAGLAPIRQALQAGRTTGTSVRLVGASPQVGRVLRLTGLAQHAG